MEQLEQYKECLKECDRCTPSQLQGHLVLLLKKYEKCKKDIDSDQYENCINFIKLYEHAKQYENKGYNDDSDYINTIIIDLIDLGKNMYTELNDPYLQQLSDAIYFPDPRDNRTLNERASAYGKEYDKTIIIDMINYCNII
jgi:hypothetical protein